MILNIQNYPKGLYDFHTNCPINENVKTTTLINLISPIRNTKLSVGQTRIHPYTMGNIAIRLTLTLTMPKPFDFLKLRFQ